MQVYIRNLDECETIEDYEMLQCHLLNKMETIIHNNKGEYPTDRNEINAYKLLEWGYAECDRLITELKNKTQP